MAADFLALAPSYDTKGKRDATGAFLPEARAFVKMHGGELRPFDPGPYAQRRRQALDSLACFSALRGVAMFCHGWRDGLQIGTLMAHARTLAGAIDRACAPFPIVALYCCDTGRDGDGERDDERAPGPGGDGGFADALRDALAELGCAATVYAHSTAGHTTRNPYVRVFAPHTRAGGDWVIAPRSPLWRAWTRALADARSTLRLRFPLMSQAELEAELRGGARADSA